MDRAWWNLGVVAESDQGFGGAQNIAIAQDEIEIGVLARERKSVATLGKYGPLRQHHWDLSRCESIENAIHLREHAEIKNHLVAERGFQSLLCVERNDS